VIPIVNLRAQYQNLREELDAAIEQVLQEGSYIQGEACRLLEKEFASFCGVASACGLASGTDALYLALKALRIGPGDEVITTPFSFIATAEAISRNGARVVFADVEDGTLNIDPREVEFHISQRTKAILPVHLYGHPASMDALTRIAQAHELAVIEDAAQAHGAGYKGKRVGAVGTVGCYSFYPTKNLGAHGDAGMLVSDDVELVERVRLLANHGEHSKYQHAIEGVSSRLDNLQAALLRVKLRHLERWNERRRHLAEIYFRALDGLPKLHLPREAPDCRAVYHQFTIRLPERDRLRRHLEKNGIASAVHYPIPLHLQPAYAHLVLGKGSLPVAERAAGEVLSLPLYPELSDEDAHRVAAAVREFISGQPT
jgi:dTDP-4-amino-4,6-dideoxygalactose transaminase